MRKYGVYLRTLWLQSCSPCPQQACVGADCRCHWKCEAATVSAATRQASRLTSRLHVSWTLHALQRALKILFARSHDKALSKHIKHWLVTPRLRKCDTLLHGNRQDQAHPLFAIFCFISIARLSELTTILF